MMHKRFVWDPTKGLNETELIQKLPPGIRDDLLIYFFYKFNFIPFRNLYY